MNVKYPNVEVQLSGVDGNVFNVVARVELALKRAGVSTEEQKEFVDQAFSGDYDNALQTCMKWVTVL